MPGFDNRLDAFLIDHRNGRDLWQLDRDLVYHSALVGKVTVPAGTITDLASVPRWPLVWLIAGGEATQAAVVHDWLYQTRRFPREICDRVFLEAMAVTGVPAWKRRLMFWAVRLGGGRAWAA